MHRYRKLDRKDQEIRTRIQKAQHPKVNIEANGGEILQNKCPFTVFTFSHSVYRKVQFSFPPPYKEVTPNPIKIHKNSQKD